MEHTARETGYTTEVYFNGESVSMVPFVKELICNVVLGLVRSLYGFDDGSEVKIVIKPEK